MNLQNISQLIADLETFRGSPLYQAIKAARDEHWNDLAVEACAPDRSLDDALCRNFIRGQAFEVKEDVVQQTVDYLKRLLIELKRKENQQQKETDTHARPRPTQTGQ